MELLLKPLQDLADKFRSLDGVGKKSAVKMAFSVLNMSEDEAKAFSDAIIAAKTQIGICKKGNGFLYRPFISEVCIIPLNPVIRVIIPRRRRGI